ncbi:MULTISPECIES: F0F1 ATP synthase subunit A [Chryseobacterium]|jgi:F-type H+-transporting ATPase subunit a|uniref:F0F1 ATP synthase subunit A n=1 Tax=unclassified Chryseobacterium TaxID=2593645 RepID=UPI0022705038|nr:MULTISPECIES: F0F1 ATP synthase subunit A [unclassified Chryseobacterium]MCY0968243.1 F0F1 ATP synthase subunit A [Chryseobacterium sp. CY353]MDF2552488.1 atpB [Chryseobacterium sp.]MDF2930742.1 atpB [Chryseobacterium sp.]
MNRKVSSLFFAFLFVFMSSFAAAQHETEGEKSAEKVEHAEGDKPFNATKMIMEHISDSNEWHLWTTKDENGKEDHFSIPLPIIIKDNTGWHTFLSKDIAHGHEHDGYTLHEGQVVSTKGIEKATLFAVISGKQKASDVFFDMSITKNTASMFLSVIFMLVIFLGMAKNYKKSQLPKGAGKLLEPVIVFIRDEVAIPNIGSVKYKRYMPYLLTAFFFIWFNNLFGLIPFFPGGANLTGNIAITSVLAIITLLITLFSANKDYWKHIFMPPVPLLLYPIMVPIEIIGIFTKPFALMMRLFANITAGHIMILAIISLIFIFKSPFLGFASVPLALFVSVLELLVAALQAYIFTVLSALFIGIAVAEHDHDHAHNDDDSVGHDTMVA